MSGFLKSNYLFLNSSYALTLASSESYKTSDCDPHTVLKGGSTRGSKGWNFSVGKDRQFEQRQRVTSVNSCSQLCLLTRIKVTWKWPWVSHILKVPLRHPIKKEKEFIFNTQIDRFCSSFDWRLSQLMITASFNDPWQMKCNSFSPEKVSQGQTYEPFLYLVSGIQELPFKNNSNSSTYYGSPNSYIWILGNGKSNLFQLK